jgi:hypothetical protein
MGNETSHKNTLRIQMLIENIELTHVDEDEDVKSSFANETNEE